MAWRIEFHPIAQVEFDEAIAWYEEQRAGLGSELFEEYRLLKTRITSNPAQFPIVAENIRKANRHRFPYLIFFTEVSGDKLRILAFFHQSRKPGAWKKR